MGDRAESAIASWGSMSASGCSVGWVVETSAAGLPIIDFPNNPYGPCSARSTIKLPPRRFGTDRRTVSVVLLFESGDPRLPIITGVIEEHPYAADLDESSVVSRENKAASDKGQDSVRVTAEKEISFVCGNSSIVLKRDGKVIIKGSYLVSRSSGQNKIKGASVAIN